MPSQNQTKPEPFGNMPSKVKKPNSFGSLEAIIEYASVHTYLFARLRKVSQGTRIQTLGTAFLAGKNRMVTCAHCINDPSSQNVLQKHQDGDSYLFVQKDQYGNGGQSVITPKFNRELFCLDDIDTAVFYLPDDFYQADGSWNRNPLNHLNFSDSYLPIGADVGVAGYPLQEIRVGTNGVDPSSFTIRADRGVVNTRYTTGDGVKYYEFTMSFNPGNSGGPIFNLDTGSVIGLVHGFTAFPVIMSNGTPVYSTYSQAISSESINRFAKKHSLSFLKN